MKKYTLAALQMAYLPVTMKEEKEGEKCLYCWTSSCDCVSKKTINDDPFINLTAEEMYNI